MQVRIFESLHGARVCTRLAALPLSLWAFRFTIQCLTSHIVSNLSNDSSLFTMSRLHAMRRSVLELTSNRVKGRTSNLTLHSHSSITRLPSFRLVSTHQFSRSLTSNRILHAAPSTASSGADESEYANRPRRRPGAFNAGLVDKTDLEEKQLPVYTIVAAFGLAYFAVMWYRREDDPLKEKDQLYTPAKARVIKEVKCAALPKSQAKSSSLEVAAATEAATTADASAPLPPKSITAPTLVAPVAVCATAPDTSYHTSFVTPQPQALPDQEWIDSVDLSTLSQLFVPSSDGHSDKYAAYSHSTDDMSLMFTSELSDPMLHRLERLVRSTQDVICQHVCNLEHDAALHSRLGNEEAQKKCDIDTSLLGAASGSGSLRPEFASQFRQDVTQRLDGTGGGIARVMQHGRVFEKAGCSCSVAIHTLPVKTMEHMKGEHAELRSFLDEQAKLPDGDPRKFTDSDRLRRATVSMSLVFHPQSPLVPTVHANFRYFAWMLPPKPPMHDAKAPPTERVIWWFGGGSDLTPMTVNTDDARHFHSVWKDVCERHDPSYYRRFKLWCDRYFYLTARRETRGVGGIFFEDLHTTPASLVVKQQNSDSAQKSSEEVKKHYERFVVDCCHSFSRSYFPLVWRHRHEPWSAEQRHWQLLRRGRYVEFNLLHDQGTSFGLKQPNARPEAILMSLPPTCAYEYRYEPKKGSIQQKTQDILQQPIDWI